VTPLQKLLTGTLLWSFVLVPLASFVIYLAPIYKAFPTVYHGTFWLIGAGAGIGAAFLFSFLWMSYVPKLLVRRAEKKKLADEKARDEKRAASKQAAADRRAEEE
jgi:hypothetical protein